jgi:hypothetical protein
MIEVLESFLHRSFIVGDGIAKLKAAAIKWLLDWALNQKPAVTRD